MNLWIRTQNRENTVKIINGYGLKYNDKKTIIANYQPDFTDKYDGYYDVLGTYKTKERALEVLDEIQNAILGILSLEDIEEQKIKQYTGFACLSKVTNCLVYEMPKE